MSAVNGKGSPLPKIPELLLKTPKKDKAPDAPKAEDSRVANIAKARLFSPTDK